MMAGVCPPALPDHDAAVGMAGPAWLVAGREGGRDPRAGGRGRRAAPSGRRSEAGLGGPGGVRRAGQGSATRSASLPAGDPGHRAGLASHPATCP